MKSKLLVLLMVVFSYQGVAQQIDYNLKKGYVAQGYDVIEYFNNKAVKGIKSYTATYDGASFKFSNEKNLKTFEANPTKYIPQYGGYCAYAIAQKGKKVGINPETFEIRDGKLYLFYNSWGTNTLEKWLEEGPERLSQQANLEWEKVKTN